MSHTKAAVYAATMREYLDHKQVPNLSAEWRATRLNLEMRLALSAFDDITAGTWAIQAMSRGLQLDELQHVDQQLVRSVLRLAADIRAKKRAS